jgi:hypothetical protein
MRFVCAAFFLCLTALSAFAQREPEIVIPGRASVPVYINGVDASWGVVEGEFGLDRPNEVAPTVIWRPNLVRLPYRVPAYYPMDGKRPGYGRLEVVPAPHHPLPPPARPYYRYWSSDSASGPVTQYPGHAPLFVAPQIYPDGRWHSNKPGGGRKGR